MTHGRKRLVTILSGFALAASIGLIPSSPAQAEPDIDDVQARVETLYHEAEQASERYNDAKIELDGLTKDLSSLEADEDRQGDELNDVREDVTDSIVRQYQGQSLSAVGQVFSNDGGNFLSQMSTMSAFGAIQDGLFDDYSTELKALTIRREATERRVALVTATEEQLAAEKNTMDTKLGEAESLLDRLKEEEREAIVSRDTVTRPATVDVPAASGRAAAAVDYAMAQVGKSYVYGAAGPSSFDCSGLTMLAWAQAGVALPHSSSAQYSSGARVSIGDLQPGDLVFYYSPISHVGIFIGDGLIVHAANPGTGVAVTGVNTMPYVGAVRPG